MFKNPMAETRFEVATDASRSRGILRERARRLALRHPEENEKPGLEVLEFAVGGDRYGLPISTLREIRPAGDLANIPGVPAFVLGVIIIRGQLVSVLDLRQLLGLSPGEASRESYAVVLANEAMAFALLADSVNEVRFLLEEDLRAGEASLEDLDRRYISAVTSSRTVVLDGEKLLSDPALVVNA